METESTPTPAAPAKPACPYCSKPIETPVVREIFDRSRDSRGKAYVRRQHVEFCSAQCGGNYQMGCEG